MADVTRREVTCRYVTLPPLSTLGLRPLSPLILIPLSLAVSDRLPDITHIVFVVHGVGQVIDDTTIIRNTNIMRDNVQSLLAKHCPHFQRDTGHRVEFFPVEWRSSLR